ncbi:MAG: sigma factor, partial [Ktedonobacteraceae bacterium]
MAENNVHKPWSELNDVTVLAALRSNGDSEYWNTCCEFVRFLVEKHFFKLQPQLKEEIVQDILLLVHKNVATFRGQSQFTTWLVSITRNRAIDVLRQLKNTKLLEFTTDELPNIDEGASACSFAAAPKT